MPRITIDTNNVISAILKPGNYASQVISAWRREQVRWIISEQTFEELQTVIRRERFQEKYHIGTEEIEELLEAIVEGTELVTPMAIEDLPIHSRDPRDDKFLVCAFEGACDYLITADEDLLTLAGRTELGSLQILNAVEFMKIIAND